MVVTPLFTFACGRCRTTFQAEVGLMGSNRKCAQCQASVQIPQFTPECFPPQPVVYVRIKPFHPAILEAASVVHYQSRVEQRPEDGHPGRANHSKAAGGAIRVFGLRAPFTMGVWVRDGSTQEILWAAAMVTGWANDSHGDDEFDARPVYRMPSVRFVPDAEHAAELLSAAEGIADQIDGVARGLQELFASPGTTALDKHVAPTPIALGNAHPTGTFYQVWYHRKI